MDIHKANAAELYGIPYAKVTKEQRRNAKALGFGVLYGMGIKKLAATLGCSEREAEHYLAEYFKKFVGIAEWKQRETIFLWQHKYVRTCTGRCRHFPQLDDDATREGLNTLIQGPASDFMLIAIVIIGDALDRGGFKARLLWQVHDSIGVGVPLAELAEVIEIMRDAMENAGKAYMPAPLQADFAIGKRWGSLMNLWEWEENDRRFPDYEEDA